MDTEVFCEMLVTGCQTKRFNNT